jgi:hypothetical protein
MFFISVPRTARDKSLRALQLEKPQDIIMSGLSFQTNPIRAGQIISTQAFITSEQAYTILDLAKNYPSKKDLLGGSDFLKYLRENTRFK